MGKVVLQPLICDHVDETIRERGVSEAPLFLLQLEVGVHGEVESVEPTYWHVNLRHTSGKQISTTCPPAETQDSSQDSSTY